MCRRPALEASRRRLARTGLPASLARGSHSPSVMVRKIAAVCGTVAGGGLLGPACGTEATNQDRMASAASVDSKEEAEVLALIRGERTGEARAAATSAGEACRVYCATSYAAACLYVQRVCVGADVVTLGGAAIPCATATAAVCLSSVALATLCADRCPP